MFVASLVICSMIESQCMAISTKVQFEEILDCKIAMNEMMGGVRRNFPQFQIRDARCKKLPGFSI